MKVGLARLTRQSGFSLWIGKDIKEARTGKTEALKATIRLIGRYKKLEEQKEENKKKPTLRRRLSYRSLWHPQAKIMEKVQYLCYDIL